jgi:DNA-binding NtrC family response regulator
MNGRAKADVELSAKHQHLLLEKTALEKAVAEGSFREDLYHRLNEFTIRVPLLSECGEDILPLAEFFLKQFSARYGKSVQGFDREAAAVLRQYGWPGNIRELKNTVRRAVGSLERFREAALKGAFHYASITASTQMNPFIYDGSFPQLAKGTTTWPDLTKSTESRNALDLWHAALNGRGRFYAIQQGDELEQAFGEQANFHIRFRFSRFSRAKPAARRLPSRRRPLRSACGRPRVRKYAPPATAS